MRVLRSLGLAVFIVGFFYLLTFFAKTGDQLPQPHWAVDDRPLEIYLIDAHLELLDPSSLKEDEPSAATELDFLLQKN